MRQRWTKSVLIDLCVEKAITALYVELSGYHGSIGKGQISTKALFAPSAAVSLDKTFFFVGRKRTIILNQLKIKPQNQNTAFQWMIHKGIKNESGCIVSPVVLDFKKVYLTKSLLWILCKHQGWSHSCNGWIIKMWKMVCVHNKVYQHPL